MGAPTPPPTSAIGFNFLATVHGQYVSGGSVSQVSGGNLANGATEQFTTTNFDNNTGDYQGTLVTTTPDGSTFTSQIVGNKRGQRDVQRGGNARIGHERL